MAKIRKRYFPVLDNDGKYMVRFQSVLSSIWKRKKLFLLTITRKIRLLTVLNMQKFLKLSTITDLEALKQLTLFSSEISLSMSCTIVYQMYCENGVEITPSFAGLMCSAIISDTLMFRSPTCTEFDKEAATKLLK